jgi:hypothetical protein
MNAPTIQRIGKKIPKKNIHPWAEEIDVLVRVALRLRAAHAFTVHVSLADVDVLFAEAGGRVVTPGDSEGLSRPKAAVGNRLHEIRRDLAEASNGRHRNPGWRFHQSPRARRTAVWKRGLEFASPGWRGRGDRHS